MFLKGEEIGEDSGSIIQSHSLNTWTIFVAFVCYVECYFQLQVKTFFLGLRAGVNIQFYEQIHQTLFLDLIVSCQLTFSLLTEKVIKN